MTGIIKYLLDIIIKMLFYAFVGFFVSLIFIYIITYNSHGDTTMAGIFILPIVFIFALVGFIKGIIDNENIQDKKDEKQDQKDEKQVEEDTAIIIKSIFRGF